MPKKAKKGKNRKLYSTRIDENIIDAVKHLSIELKMPVGEIIEESIRCYMKQHPTFLKNCG